MNKQQLEGGKRVTDILLCAQFVCVFVRRQVASVGLLSSNRRPRAFAVLPMP
jgi:hypothetical protein